MFHLTKRFDKEPREIKYCISDIEANGLRPDLVTKIWCATILDLQTGKILKFHPENEGPDQYHNQFGECYKKKLEEYDVVIGHNFLGYDAPVINIILGTKLDWTNVIDTSVLSRLFRPVSPPVQEFGRFKKLGWDTRAGGHSLKAWGLRLGEEKISFDDFEQFTFEQMEYCAQDCITNKAILDCLLYEFKTFNFSDDSCEIEHRAHQLLTQQYLNGFALNVRRAEKLVDETSNLTIEYTNKLQEIFPPRKVLVRNMKPRFNKETGEMHGQDKKTLLKNLYEKQADGSFNIYSMETFNPNSPSQVGSRLVEIGWKPRKFTKTGQASTSKEVIGEAIEQLADSYPQVQVLKKFNIVTHRNQIASEWLELSKGDGRVHGSVFHIGPWTHRSSHRSPNMGNIPKVVLDEKGNPIEGLNGNFGWDARHCLVAEKGKVIVGADASGIQLRALAHYINDENYIRDLLEGDIHLTNMVASGIGEVNEKGEPKNPEDRKVAKTFIYAWLLGAGDEKIGIIVGVSEEEYEDLFKEANAIKRYNPFREKRDKDTLLWYISDRLESVGRRREKDVIARILKGHLTKKKFLDNLPALKTFKEQEIKKAAVDSFMTSLDGRKIWVPSEHLAMGAYLQGFEAVIMKKAMILYHEDLERQEIEFKQVAYVHDEFQIECRPEDAEKVGQTVVWAITEAGKQLGSICPLDGEYGIGSSWAQTH